MQKSNLGLTAVDFEVPDIHGRSHGLAEFSGHWLLLVFHRHLG